MEWATITSRLVQRRRLETVRRLYVLFCSSISRSGHTKTVIFYDMHRNQHTWWAQTLLPRVFVSFSALTLELENEGEPVLITNTKRRRRRCVAASGTSWEQDTRENPWALVASRVYLPLDFNPSYLNSHLIRSICSLLDMPSNLSLSWPLDWTSPVPYHINIDPR